MNNEQFRRLLLSNSSGSQDDHNTTSSSSSFGQTRASLGSRHRASTHMTPRSVVGSSRTGFTNQSSQRSGLQPAKKKQGSSTPKGAALAEGYVDRARERAAKQGDIEDGRATRIKVLEDSLKTGDIGRSEFDRMRGQIAGGDVESTHLVKGLDFQLLERVRRGEDVFNVPVTATDTEPVNTDDGVDDKLDQIRQSEIKVMHRGNKERKHGQLTTVTSGTNKKRTRDQILADFKAARAAAKTQQFTLGARFKKVGIQQLVPGTERVEIDCTGRKVKIVVDEDGHERETVLEGRPGDSQAEATARKQFEVNMDGNVLGMEVPDVYQKKQDEASAADEEADDIFSEVGDDYDPLVGLRSSDHDESDYDDDDGKMEHKLISERSECEVAASAVSELQDVVPTNSAQPRNYFQGSKIGLVSAEFILMPSTTDPAFLAAIKKAASLKRGLRVEQNMIAEKDDEGGAEEEDEREARRLDERRFKKLDSIDRDEVDIDLGFGTSRFGDDDDDEELSRWGDDGGKPHSHAARKRKRGPKKRKVDVNNVAEVMRVVERRSKG